MSFRSEARPRPPITQVCRAIRHECMPYFCTSNTFYIFHVWNDRHGNRLSFREHMDRVNVILSHSGKVYLLCQLWHWRQYSNIRDYERNVLTRVSWRKALDEDAADLERLRGEELVNDTTQGDVVRVLQPNARTDKPFNLFGVPPKLWSRICKLAVVDPEPIRLAKTNGTSYYQVPPIAQVCRAIRAECLPHFYTHNIFYAREEWLHGAAKLPRSVGDQHDFLHLKRLEKLYLICGNTCYDECSDDCHRHQPKNFDDYAQEKYAPMGLKWRDVRDEDKADVAELDWIVVEDEEEVKVFQSDSKVMGADVV